MDNSYLNNDEFIKALMSLQGEEEAPKIKNTTAKVGKGVSVNSNNDEQTSNPYAALLGLLKPEGEVRKRPVGSDVIDVLGQSAAYAIDPSMRPDFSRVGAKKKTGISDKDMFTLAASLLKDPKAGRESLEEYTKKRQISESVSSSGKKKAYQEKVQTAREAYASDLEALIDKIADKATMWGKDYKSTLGKEKAATAEKLQEYLNSMGLKAELQQADIRKLAEEAIQSVSRKKGFGSKKAETKKSSGQTEQNSVQSDKVRVQLPDGRVAVVSKGNLTSARKKYPGLKIVK